MIYLGFEEHEKHNLIVEYRNNYSIRNTVIISPKQFPLMFGWSDNIEWSDTIEYETFYRLLQEITEDSLVVLSEPLRSQNRYDLTYNCIRHFLQQTKHKIIFQQFPQIDIKEDFMILFDFDTNSKWKKYKWDINLILDNIEINVKPLLIQLNGITVQTQHSTKEKYYTEKTKMFNQIGNKNPDTIPRNLYLVGGKDKHAYIKSQCKSLFKNDKNVLFVARNQRLKSDNILTYKNARNDNKSNYILIELPHKFIDFTDFLKANQQLKYDLLVADLKVDKWYLKKYTDWINRINETYTNLLKK